ncbi:MAG: GNAT family N-acetyltransferase [Kangiellaceae bacterium]|nr:GNAT family N-acetyltransferase [Kangiellaceae bacterium]MCW8999373.1 GNAT family N-acetyltransferase [Kangiellaceae bacterium]MCW9015474.1 GNAT family N-acetyltransferase [Kangiellaceae bacterium]
MLQFILAKPQDSQKIADLAKPIWEEHYTPIIGAEQVKYMLDKFQSAAAVEEQIDSGYQYYLVKNEHQCIGYIALEKRNTTLFISKFYLSSEFRGKGLAKLMLARIFNIATQLNCDSLELTVNKFNPAYKAYLKLGFENIESIQIDIGNGFIMDDYRMCYKLSSNLQKT